MSLSAICISLSTKFRHSDTEIPTTLCAVPRIGPSPTHNDAHLYVLENQNYPLSVSISCRHDNSLPCIHSCTFVHLYVLQER